MDVLEFHDFLGSKVKHNAINIGCDRLLEVVLKVHQYGLQHARLSVFSPLCRFPSGGQTKRLRLRERDHGDWQYPNRGLPFLRTDRQVTSKWLAAR